MYKEQGIIENFEQLLDNIFQPLFEVTKDPNSHPQLHLFLKNVSQLHVAIAHLHDWLPASVVHCCNGYIHGVLIVMSVCAPLTTTSGMHACGVSCLPNVLWNVDSST